MLPVTQNDERELKSSIFQDIIRKMCSTLKSHWIACTKIDFHPGWPQVWWFVPSLKNLTELIPAGFNYINVTEGRNSWFVNVSPACNFFCLRVFSVIFFCVVTSTELFREDGSAPRPAPTAFTIEHPWFHLRSRTNVLSFVSGLEELICPLILPVSVCLLLLCDRQGLTLDDRRCSRSGLHWRPTFFILLGESPQREIFWVSCSLHVLVTLPLYFHSTCTINYTSDAAAVLTARQSETAENS